MRTGGVRQGAPDAVQVADRWHLLRNLGDALQAIVERHHATARRIATEVAADLGAGAPTAGPPAIERPDAATTPRGPAVHAGRRARFEEAVRLHAAGVSLPDLSAPRNRLQNGPAMVAGRRHSVLVPAAAWRQARRTPGSLGAAVG